MTHSLRVGRWDHLGWGTEGGDILLIGGSDIAAKNSTETLSASSSAIAMSWTIDYDVL